MNQGSTRKRRITFIEIANEKSKERCSGKSGIGHLTKIVKSKERHSGRAGAYCKAGPLLATTMTTILLHLQKILQARRILQIKHITQDSAQKDSFTSFVLFLRYCISVASNSPDSSYSFASAAVATDHVIRSSR
jgi:hypothetical protein